MGKSGTGPGWLWLCSLSLALILLMMLAVIWLITANSVTALWPSRLERVELADGNTFLGIRVGGDIDPDGRERLQYKVANRELNAGIDFRWVDAATVVGVSFPTGAMLVKRGEGGDFYGVFLGLAANGTHAVASDPGLLGAALTKSRNEWNTSGRMLSDRLDNLGLIWQDIRLQSLRAGYISRIAATEAERKRTEEHLESLGHAEESVKAESAEILAQLAEIKMRLAAGKAAFLTGDGRRVEIPLPGIVDAWAPNAMSRPEKFCRCLRNGWAFLSEWPREANTDGGLFPALFGTTALIFLMSISAFPLGVAAGIYLREYSKGGWPSRLARVAVNNLAGVPSIVYGIFGLGFFVYGLGGRLDRLLYPERVEAGVSTFGTGGILWSSLTLGLLTLPVVIVATEEALASVPGEMRQGSFALGATRFQTLRLVLLPMAAPGILTGFILAMARAAGEVAPLMLTGVVKSAPGLAVGSSWPFIHLDRKFMHLGFHIYDMGFQSPNVEASKPLVYLTALILLALVFALNIVSFKLRGRMRKRYAMKGF